MLWPNEDSIAIHSQKKATADKERRREVRMAIAEARGSHWLSGLVGPRVVGQHTYRRCVEEDEENPEVMEGLHLLPILLVHHLDRHVPGKVRFRERLKIGERQGKGQG